MNPIGFGSIDENGGGLGVWLREEVASISFGATDKNIANLDYRFIDEIGGGRARQRPKKPK